MRRLTYIFQRFQRVQLRRKDVAKKKKKKCVRYVETKYFMILISVQSVILLYVMNAFMDAFV